MNVLYYIALAFFTVVAIITNLSTFAAAKVLLFFHSTHLFHSLIITILVLFGVLNPFILHISNFNC